MENVRHRTNLEFIPYSEYVRKIERQSDISFKGIVNHYPEFSVYEYKKGYFFR